MEQKNSQKLFDRNSCDKYPNSVYRDFVSYDRVQNAAGNNM